MGVDSPDVVIATRLLDHAKLRGFAFRRIAPGEDGPLVGQRVSGDWVDILYLAGFSRDCLAGRQRTSSLILPGNGLMERRVGGQRARCAQRGADLGATTVTVKALSRSSAS